MFRKRAGRRGVVLLIVLSMLVLFTLMVVTFVVVTGQYRSAAVAAAKYRRTGDDPRKLFDVALYQLLRDVPSGFDSSLRDQSLLGDFYGNDGLKAQVAAGVLTSGATALGSVQNQFITISFSVPTSSGLPQPRQLEDYYNGRVLTMLGGNAGGLSTRIVDYYFHIGVDSEWGELMVDDNGDGNDNILDAFMGTNDDEFRVVVEAFRPESSAGILPGDGDWFIINGQPFNGTGYGYDPTTGNLDSDVWLPGPDLEWGDAGTDDDGNTVVDDMSEAGYGDDVKLSGFAALLSHRSGPAASGRRGGSHALRRSTGTPPPSISIDVGGKDESWDAVDYQNMFLAMVPPDFSTYSEIIPSFHRPSLVNFLRVQLEAFFNANSATYPLPSSVLTPAAFENPASLPASVQAVVIQAKRACIFRPLQEDNPAFTGGNSNYNSLGNQAGGVWDVDNDGDGVRDSIWMDIGLPVKAGPDGRLYRPLVAILCKDMDGRLNLNAHDNNQHLTTSYQQYDSTQKRFNLAPVTGSFASATSATLARGIGTGPAEVSLGPIFNENPTEYTPVVQGRYLAPGVTNPLPGRVDGADDDIDSFRNSDVPNDFYNGIRTAYASPPDSRGIGAIGLDANGFPLMYGMGQLNERQDDPYEFLLGYLDGVSSRDTPYSLAEQELLLRWFDIDASQLPNRLARLGQSAFSIAKNRESVTAHSSHVPIPNVVPSPEARAGASIATPVFPSGTILDLYRQKLIDGGLAATRIRRELLKIVPFEMRQGQLFDINRRIGNGRDENGNGVVDEPSEALVAERAWPNANSTEFSNRQFDHSNDDAIQSADSRQIFARHLYCLMMLLVDAGYVHPVATADDTTLNATQKAELTARRIAQWAINVVDFRDPDSIMTPFEYDIDPFDGWDVDHVISSTEVGPGPDGKWGIAGIDDDSNMTVDDISERGATGSDDGSDNAHSDRRVVWGTESPELLITETVAFHDRRVRDTNNDNNAQLLRTSMPTNDPNLDQFRIPQGSLFFELRNVRSPGGANRQQLPSDLYDATGKLNLAYVHPTASSDGLRYPLWRIAISEQHSTGAAARANSPLSRATAAPDATSFAPPEMSSVSGAAAPLAISRLVWFANLNPGVRALAGSTYYNSSGWSTSLDPGQSLVVGPRATTYIGSVDDMDPSTPWDGNSPQVIELSSTAIDPADPQQHRVRVTDSNGNAAAIPGTTTVLGLAVDAAPPTGWTNAGRRIGLSVTEPIPSSGSYYQEPNPTNDARNPTDAYDDLAAPTNSLPDVPFDGQTTVPPRPLERFSNSTGTGTYTNFASAFLQRLANPLVPYDATTNPYVTVDWSTIDVTVFSGEENTNRQVTTPGGVEWVDPSDSDPFSTTVGWRERFGTRSRGDAANDVPIWSPLAPQASLSTSAVIAMGSTPFFRHDLTHSLGHIGTNVDTPFPWLTWNNRPFTSPAELLLVPASTPSRFLFEFSKATSATPYASYGTTAEKAARFKAPYGHLLNLFHSRGKDPAGTPPVATDQGANFFRLFDFIETPSPYVETQRWYNPEVFENATISHASGLRPPYNKVSQFRDPGRVNINTIFDPLVWEGVTQGIPELMWRRGTDTKWGGSASSDPSDMGIGGDDSRFYANRLLISRQGYGRQGPGTAYQQLGFNDSFPTRFANPFRAANGADLMPGAVSSMRLDGVQATLWRADHSLDTATGLLTPSSSPLFDVSRPDDEPYHSTDGNPYFRYQGFQKISNVLTTHSNVFAIWMTIGFFEVEVNPGGVDVGHPDGYRLTQELGTDTGEIERKRAFFMVDRSIPVGFEFGENHNVDRAVLIRRFIE